MKPSTPEIEILAGPAELADRAAELFVSLAEQAMAARDRFCVALSGGSTPLAMYARLVQPGFKERVVWSKTHLFWGDERCVPPDHPDSNFGSAQKAFLDHVPIPIENRHRILGELKPAQAALAYERELSIFLEDASLPRLDLTLLGLGEDGHTASLFPGSPALLEKARWVVAVEHQQPPPPLVDRVTLTPLVINASRFILILVSGAGKAVRLSQVLQGPYLPKILPAQLIQPQQGQLLWLIDQPAAASIHGAHAFTV